MCACVRVCVFRFCSFAAVGQFFTAVAAIGQLFTEAGELFTGVGQLFTEAGELFTAVGQLFTEAGQLFTAAGQLFSAVTESVRICDDCLPQGLSQYLSVMIKDNTA